MNFEESRLRTFHSWPANAVVEPQRVAKAGFFYTEEGLTVECFSCGGRISEWDYGDQVMAKHRQLNPECSFVRNPMQSGNVPVLNISSSNKSLHRSDTSQSSANSLSGPNATENSQNRLSESTPNSLMHSTSVSSISSLVGCNDPLNSPNSLHSSSESRSNSLLGCSGSVSSVNSFHLANTSESPSNSQLDNALRNPTCNFDVLSRSESPPAVQTGISNQATLYRSEAARLETFRTWPKTFIISPERLARAGFFYFQEEDKVQCAFCSGVIGHWEAGDDPDREHRRHFPSCPLHYNIPVGNIPIGVETYVSSPEGTRQYHDACDNVILREVRPFSTPETEERKAVEEHLKSLPEEPNMIVEGIQSHRGPRHPKYSTVESRLRTYANWPSNLRQTPPQLAQAGFYYTGMHDQVRCFHCDGGLRQWDDSDDPWVEHARWFSKCVYVVLMKGEEFIQEVAAQYPPFLPVNALQEESKPVSVTNQSPFQIRDVTEEELNGLMNTLPVQMAVRVGLDISKIKRAVRQKMEQTGLPYTTSDALIGAVLDMSSGTHTPDSPTPGPSQESVSVHNNSISHHNHLPETDVEGRQQGRDELYASSGIIPISQSMPIPAQEAVEARLRVQSVVDTSTTKNVLHLSSTNLSASDIKKGSGEDSSVSLEEENRRLKEARLCKICMDEEVGVVFLPCGHLVTCVNCTPSLQDCPLCRQPIKATVRTFLS